MPSSADRLYTLIYPDRVSFSLTIVAGLVLPLMGFWNSVIYPIISRDAVRDLLAKYVRLPLDIHGSPAMKGEDSMGKSRTLASVDPTGEFDMGRGKSDGSLGDSINGLASKKPLSWSMV